jgi:Holliday junction resolvase RusA-like endonuclease
MEFILKFDTNVPSHQQGIRLGKRGVYKTEKLETFQQEAAYKLQNDVRESGEHDFPLTSPVALVIVFYPKTRKHGDMDNMEKTIIDAMQGVLFANDKQIKSKTTLIIEPDIPQIHAWVHITVALLQASDYSSESRLR